MAKVHRAYRHTWWHWKVARFTVIYDRQAEESTENYKWTLDDITRTLDAIHSILQRSKLVYAPSRHGVGLEPVDLDEADRMYETVKAILRKADVDFDTALALTRYQPPKSYWQEYDEKRVQAQLDHYTVDKRGIRDLTVDEVPNE